MDNPADHAPIIDRALKSDKRQPFSNAGAELCGWGLNGI
jgi:hypothetical protein